MSIPARPDPVGLMITRWQVRGEEVDVGGHWVGADIAVAVDERWEFLLVLQTKHAFVTEALDSALNLDMERLLDDHEDEAERRDAYVVNERILTDAVIERELQGRSVDHALAESMFFEGPLRE